MDKNTVQDRTIQHLDAIEKLLKSNTINVSDHELQQWLKALNDLKKDVPVLLESYTNTCTTP